MPVIGLLDLVFDYDPLVGGGVLAKDVRCERSDRGFLRLRFEFKPEGIAEEAEILRVGQPRRKVTGFVFPDRAEWHRLELPEIRGLPRPLLHDGSIAERERCVNAAAPSIGRCGRRWKQPVGGFGRAARLRGWWSPGEKLERGSVESAGGRKAFSVPRKERCVDRMWTDRTNRGDCP